MPGDAIIDLGPEYAPGIDVDIDIKPGSDLNPINPMSRSVIPVAVLGSDGSDVADVDVTTLAFGPAGATPALFGRGWRLDVNRDGFTDLLTFYRTWQSGIDFVDMEACLSGETLYGTLFDGCDAIETLPDCGRGIELALLPPPLMWLYTRRRRRQVPR